MSLYTDAAYNPSFQVGVNAFLFLNEPKINIRSMRVNNRNRVTEFVVPGQDGSVILGSDKDGLEIDLELEIASADLENFTTRRIALEDIVQGDVENKFDFYLRFVDSSNYWVYTHCTLVSISLQEGPQNPLNPELPLSVFLTLKSEDSTPTIVHQGTVELGAQERLQDGVHIINAAKILIADELIVQNEFGVIKCRLSAITGNFEITGIITQDL